MLKKLLLFSFLFVSLLSYSQIGGRGMNLGGGSTSKKQSTSLKDREEPDAETADTIATVDMYKIITLERDTIIVDTSLTIDKEFTTNYLRKDNFGMLQLPNDGQAYNVLDYGMLKHDPFPQFGFSAKHHAYMQVNDIHYYNVATPYTDVMYRSTQTQGQILDALFTVNTSEQLNLFVGYKGLRSIGKYINNLSSNGNFRIGGSYNTESKRYFAKFHFAGQDFSNNENGGITDPDLFEGGDATYSQRERLDVYFRDAQSVMKGNRFFLDHTFRLSKSNPNSIVLHHQFNYEYKYFEFYQPTVSDRFGESYTSSIRNRTRYNRMYNLIGAAYSNETIGDIEFYIEDYNYNYFYRSVILSNDFSTLIPNSRNDRINTYGAKYTYQKNNWNGTALLSNSITDQSLANIDVKVSYKFDDKNQVSARFQKMNKLPDLNYQLYQSDYKRYNWTYNWSNEKINTFEFEAKTRWLDASVQYSILKDHLYFANEHISENIANAFDTLYVRPYQNTSTINYLSLRAHKDIRFGVFGLDNTLLYQNVQQSGNILNVPSFLTRNTIYYTDKWFKKALQVQTGLTFQYFTEYYANDYNPLLGEFYVQDKRKIGNFPMVDFFFNMKIQEFRLFLRAEHFNSSFTGYNYYSTPTTPYRDFTVRFGVIWDFFS